jgi:hypothetical protein
MQSFLLGGSIILFNLNGLFEPLLKYQVRLLLLTFLILRKSIIKLQRKHKNVSK